MFYVEIPLVQGLCFNKAFLKFCTDQINNIVSIFGPDANWVQIYPDLYWLWNKVAHWRWFAYPVIFFFKRRKTKTFFYTSFLIAIDFLNTASANKLVYKPI